MSKIRRYCGIAEEATYGEGPPPEAEVHLDISGSSLDVPGDANIIYDGGARRTARIYRPGFYAPAGNVVYALDINTIGYFLKWALGEYEFTSTGGAGSLHLHEMWGTEDSTLPSFCARVGKDLFEHVFSGCAVNSLEINVGDGLCMATVDIAAQKDAKTTLEAGELDFPADYPLAFHEVTARIVKAGPDEDISTQIKDLTLTINNNAAADDGRHIGNRHPARIPVNDRETTLSLAMHFEDLDMLERYWGDSGGPAAAGSEEFKMAIVLDAGDNKKLEIFLPKVIVTTPQQQPSGRAQLEQSVDIRALVGEVELQDASKKESEILCSLENEATEYGGSGT